MPKHYIVYKCRGNYWEIRSSEVYFKFWRKVIFVFKSFWKEGKRKSKNLICLPASTGIFIPFKCRSSIDTTVSMGLPTMALPFTSYLGKDWGAVHTNSIAVKPQSQMNRLVNYGMFLYFYTGGSNEHSLVHTTLMTWLEGTIWGQIQSHP